MAHFLYLSPHFDDAALSCGGILLQQPQRGERATVLTICAGRPDYTHLSSFALVQHRQWGEPRDPIATRHAEDEAAMRRLGVQGAYLDIPDAIYRRDARGRPVVFSNRSLFGPVHLDEQPLVQRIARAITAQWGKQVHIVAPLGAGRHVDHQLTRDATLRLMRAGYRVTWYEDYTYAEKRGAVTRARQWFGALAWQCAVFPIDVERKIETIRAYRSQLNSTFKGARDMAKRLRAYNRKVAGGQGYAERIWNFSV